MLINPPMREVDEHGFGHYHAPRKGRLHNGVDVACYPKSRIRAISGGLISKVGRPYYFDNPRNSKEELKNQLRYVEVTNGITVYRYFYVFPEVHVGDTVIQGQVIGEAQDLIPIFGDGMTNHIHVEIKENGNYIDPTLRVFPDGTARYP